VAKPKPLERALRKGERFGELERAFLTNERFYEYTIERRKVGQVVIASNRLAVCDPFGLGFGFKELGRRVPRGRFPVDVSVAHVRKGKRKGKQVVAAARVRFSKEAATGYRLAEIPGSREARLLGASFSGYAVESGSGCFGDAEAIEALDEVCSVAFTAGELDCEANRDLRERLRRPPAAQRGWGAAQLDGLLGARGGNMIAFTAGHGEGVYPSFWGYDDERRLVSLVTDFLVLPTSTDLCRESWGGQAWREFVYEGDRVSQFWRIKVKGARRSIQHGVVGNPGQTHDKEFATSDAAMQASVRRIVDQTDRGYYELTSEASRIKTRKSQRARRLKRHPLESFDANAETRLSERLPGLDMPIREDMSRRKKKEKEKARAKEKAARKKARAKEKARTKKKAAEKKARAKEKAARKKARAKEKEAKERARTKKKAQEKRARTKEKARARPQETARLEKKAGKKKAAKKKAGKKKAAKKKAGKKKAAKKKAGKKKAAKKKSTKKKAGKKKSTKKKAGKKKSSAASARTRRLAPAPRKRRR
jgi:predicted DNA-binding WGR domain protein